MVPPGETFDASSREHARILRRPHYAARVEMVEGTYVAPVDVAELPLKMDPETYLRIHPKGPKAKLARELVGVGGPRREKEDVEVS